MSITVKYDLFREIYWQDNLLDPSDNTSYLLNKYLVHLPLSCIERLCIPISVLNLSIIYHSPLTPLILKIFKENYHLSLDEETASKALSPLRCYNCRKRVCGNLSNRVWSMLK